MKTVTLVAAAVVACSLPAWADDFKITNGTGGDYDHIHLSAPGKNAWGADLAAKAPAKSLDEGKQLLVKGVAAGVYDVKLTDEDDATNVCIIRNVSFTGDAVKLISSTCRGH